MREREALQDLREDALNATMTDEERLALGAELRQLRGEVRRLEEDNQLLHERIGQLQRELEQTRAKIPRKISTS